MIIQWYGQSCFKVQNGDITLVFDPFSGEIGLNPPRGKADIVCISHNHLDHNNIKFCDEGCFVVEGPGEYDVKNVVITGIRAFHGESEKSGANAIYAVEIADIKICHLGDLGQKELNPDQLEAIGDVDILMIPIGGEYSLEKEKYRVLDYGIAAKIINQIEPKIVIPMHYQIPKLKIKLDGVDNFLKEMGASKVSPVDKLTLKKKDLPQGEMNVVVMKVG